MNGTGWIIKYTMGAFTWFYDGQGFVLGTIDRALQFPSRAAAESVARQWAEWPYDNREIRVVPAIGMAASSPQAKQPTMSAEEHNRFPKGRWS